MDDLVTDCLDFSEQEQLSDRQKTHLQKYVPWIPDSCNEKISTRSSESSGIADNSRYAFEYSSFGQNLFTSISPQGSCLSQCSHDFRTSTATKGKQLLIIICVGFGKYRLLVHFH